MTKEDLPEKRAYSQYRKGYLDAVQNSTGIVLEQAEMDRAEIEAITGPALREQVIDDEFFFVNYSERKYDAGASGEPGRMILADYDGISVLYGIMGDGEVRSLIFTSGHWYRMANGFDMGDSAADIKALLGEYAVCSDEEFEKEHDFRYMRAALCRDAEGLRLITEEERKDICIRIFSVLYCLAARESVDAG